MTGKKKHFSRRNFLYSSFAGIAALGLRNLTARNPSFRNRDPSFLELKNNIIYRKLGSTGLILPVVNMGVMNALGPALVRRAYELGVRHFDTAAWYQQGRNEEMIGNVIRELKVRDNVIIGTKIYVPHQQRNMTSTQAKDTYLTIAEESLKRLQTDYIDILYSHDVSTLEWLNNPGILEALQILKKEGKARFIGFSTHQNMAECINEAVRTGFYDIILTAFNYAMVDDENLINALKNADSNGIGLMAMKTQCSQYWYREYVPEGKREYYKGRILQTAVLKWVLRHDFITTAIPGCTTFKQIEDDMAVARDLDYTPEEKQFLEDRNVKDSLGYCQQCSRCLPTCPNGVDIPALMRTHMYAACYSNFYQARDTLDEIPRGKSIQICRSCMTCVARCVNSVNIARRIDELKMIYI